MMKKGLLLLALLVFLSGAPVFAQYTLYHSFYGSEGYNLSHGPLASDGTTLYGTTLHGGSSTKGWLYKIDADGTDFQDLYNFTGGTTGGDTPLSNPILVGSWLYGTTEYGGTDNRGTIYKIGTDGNNFAILHSFGSSEGYYPFSGLTKLGTTLYGMTWLGGTGYAGGTIFKIDTDGNNYAVVHVFAGGESDGYKGYGSLTTDGSVFYGTTLEGGTGNKGVVFKLDPVGPTLTVLHSFSGYEADGEAPTGYLVLDNGVLYGMTQKGGANDKGTVFIMSTDGDGTFYAKLHEFQGGVDDGQTPADGLIKISSMLYGFTAYGGSAEGTGLGTMFMVENTGNAFALLLRFETETGIPPASVPRMGLLTGSNVIGTTESGGSSGEGTVFSFDILPRADVAITMQTDNLNPQGGANVNFTITAQNNGPYTATGVKVTDLLPAQLTYVSDSPTQGSYERSTGVWDIGRLGNPNEYPPSSTATLTLTARVNSSGAISNTATRTAENEIDPNSANDSATSNINTAQTKNLLPPILLEPAYDVTGLPTTVTLQWQDTNNTPQEVKYKVRIKKAGGSYVNYTLAANTVQYIKTGLALGKVYYWNVQAVGNGTTSKTSAWGDNGIDYKFTVAPPVTLKAPTLTSPANGATGQPTSVSLQWTDTNSSPDELHYKVRFKVAGGLYTTVTLDPGTTSLLKTGLKSGKTYCWSVQAIGNGTSIKNSVWPADFKFTATV